MRVSDSSYEGYVNHLVAIVHKLPVSDEMRASFLQQVQDYRDVADPVRGAPQPNIQWTRGNARGGYRNDIPGLISEILSQYVLSIFYENAVVVAQDQHTQVNRAIDMFVNRFGVQSKTFCFKGPKAYFESTWGAGEADWVTLTDIDDHETFVVPISFIRDNAGKWVDYRDLKSAAIHYLNMHKVY